MMQEEMQDRQTLFIGTDMTLKWILKPTKHLLGRFAAVVLVLVTRFIFKSMKYV